MLNMFILVFEYILPPMLAAAVGTLVGVWIQAIRNIRRQQESESLKQGALVDGILALLHDRIYGECAACEAKGFVAIEALRNIEYLYDPYHTLGGNGTGTLLYERIKKLPVRTEERGK